MHAIMHQMNESCHYKLTNALEFFVACHFHVLSCCANFFISILWCKGELSHDKTSVYLRLCDLNLRGKDIGYAWNMLCHWVKHFTGISRIILNRITRIAPFQYILFIWSIPVKHINSLSVKTVHLQTVLDLSSKLLKKPYRHVSAKTD